MAVDLRQTHFRFGKDDNSEVAHTWWELEDVDHTQIITADWTFLLRFVEQESGGTAAGNTDAVFQYNKNGAGWNDITTTSAVVRAVAVDAFTNGQNCTQRLSGTGTFETTAAGCTEDGTSGGPSNDIVANGNSETEAGLQVVDADVANNDTIQLRFRSPDWTVTYTITPTLTIQKGSSVTLASVVAGIATATAAVAIAIIVAATSIGIGTTAGALAVARPLAAVSAGLETTAAALAVARPLAAVSAGVSTAASALTVTAGGVTLAATTNGVATAAGAISITRGLAATSVGIETSSSALAIERGLAGTSAGVATASADVKLQRNLAAISAGIAAPTGSLSITKLLSAVSAGIGNLVSALNIKVRSYGLTAVSSLASFFTIDSSFARNLSIDSTTAPGLSVKVQVGREH